MGQNLTSAASHGTETSSRCVTNSTTATHNFEVTNFSLLVGKCVKSSTFIVGGCDWNIHVYPDGWRDEDKEHVSVFLCLLINGLTPTKYSLSLLDKDGQVYKQGEPLQYTFHAVNGYWGFPQFVERSKVKELLSLNADRFTIRCVLTVIEPSQTEDVIPSPRVIEAPPSNMHQHFERLLKDGKGTDPRT